jgi:hypothetical protein
MSFVSYISIYNTDNIKNFKNIFKSEINHLPDICLSSKAIRNLLQVDNNEKDLIFKQTFLEYFKWKLNECVN